MSSLHRGCHSWCSCLKELLTLLYLYLLIDHSFARLDLVRVVEHIHGIAIRVQHAPAEADVFNILVDQSLHS